MKASDVTEELTAAIRWRNLSVIQSLLEKGADPNILSTSGCTALHVAAEHGEAESAILLMNYKGLFYYKSMGHKSIEGYCALLCFFLTETTLRCVGGGVQVVAIDTKYL